MKEIFNQFFILPISILLLSLYTIFNDLGISIIILTLIIKIVLLPISFTQFVEEKKIQRIRERIESETKEIKDLLQKAEIMNKIYLEEKFNPLKNMLIQIITLPIYLAIVISIYDISKKILNPSFLGLLNLIKPNFYLGAIAVFLNFYYAFTQPPESRKILLFVLGIISVIIFTLPAFLVLYFLVMLILGFLERKIFNWYYIKFIIKSI